MENNELFDWVKSIIVAFVLAFFIKAFIMETTQVIGISMEPTLIERDRLFSNRIVLKFKEPVRGDIVVIKAPDQERTQYIKRVIGVGGDIVQIIDGQVFINGSKIVEDYIDKHSYTDTYEEVTWQVKEGELFVLGDNREMYASKDSRSFGCIKVEDVLGISKFRYYPFDSNFGRIDKIK